MASPHETTAVAEDGMTTQERRRPGRMEEISPALLPLLREKSILDLPMPAAHDDDLGSARGVVFGLMVSAVFWIFVALIYYLI